MKRFPVILHAALFALAALQFLPVASLNAQTNFVKYTGNPVLPLGNPGEWDDVDAAFAYVIFDGSQNHLWYSGNGTPGGKVFRIGYATSNDGIVWDKHNNNPVLDFGTSGDFDSQNLMAPFMKCGMWEI